MSFSPFPRRLPSSLFLSALVLVTLFLSQCGAHVSSVAPPPSVPWFSRVDAFASSPPLDCPGNSLAEQALGGVELLNGMSYTTTLDMR